MAWLIFCIDGREIDRRRLTGSLVVGRSAVCDVCIRDRLISRRHCRIEREERGWIAVDLNSKNGLWLKERRIQRRALRDGDQLRMGRLHVMFAVQPKPLARSRSPQVPLRPRPARMLSGVDPSSEAADDFLPQLELPAAPRPRPADPPSYAREDMYGLFNAIASSSWDSIYDGASSRQRDRQLPRLVPPRLEPHTLDLFPNHQDSFKTPVTARSAGLFRLAAQIARWPICKRSCD
jgi:predicted component of type VI protein secretion system